jgi:hypothetical protein
MADRTERNNIVFVTSSLGLHLTIELASTDVKHAILHHTATSGIEDFQSGSSSIYFG